MANDPIHIVGLREFNKALKGLDSNLPKGVRLALNEAANLIIDKAVPKVPSRTGRARRSLAARSTRTTARVAGGGTKAPYYPWLDFGGTNGRGVKRPFYKDGRYLYATYYEHQDEFVGVMAQALNKVAEDAGLVID
ncbi:HK97 gp10 family phage protein [Asanoa siamensis]|uniref:HK97 gp10 family phage protein n=1 Tax=Asanoa siamensis TaxID=926357 RepID=A0ABQ4CKV1_9ACTN|nr:HK97 gp10 family phage protein [Asanoa siamensis]GIF71911.1 hypothetical protein Asi02nite_14290 [Asanoa siamensis]